MKLYLLTPVSRWKPWYDKVMGLVVRAESEDHARDLASSVSGDEGADAWRDSALTKCVELTSDGPAGLILRDFA